LVKKGAAEVLGRMGNKQAIPALISLLNHEDEGVRLGVVWALERLGEPQVVPALISALQDRDGSVRQEATAALGIIGNLQAVEALENALHHEDIHVKVQAALAFDRMGSPKGIQALIPALDDKDLNVKMQVINAFGQMINLQEIAVLVIDLRNEVTAINNYLYRIEDFSTNPNLVFQLEDKVSKTKILHIIIELKIQVFEVLKDLYSDEFPLRSVIASALCEMGEVQIVEEFISALSHEDISIRLLSDFFLSKFALTKQAKETLSYIKPQAVQELMSALKHEDLSVRQAAALALLKIRERQTIPALISALNDQYGNVVNPALEALAQIGTSDILEKLIENPEIDIYRPDIFLLARKLTVRYRNEGLPFIPVYHELVNREANTGT
jgi:hypothetical protein